MFEPRLVSDDIWWVGALDWNVRNFHGYTTDRGTTYNAYLIMDEKITLVDTVAGNFTDEMIDRITHVVDPARIDYIISNHAEPDHSGGIIRMLEVAPDAQVIAADPHGVNNLKGHFGGDIPFVPVKSGDTLSIGKRTLHFVHTPMAHWPDSMVTYSPEDRALFSMDIFGQHYATSVRFDYECDGNLPLKQAADYYANIVQPFHGQVVRALEAIEGLEMDIIAPAHGIIWKERIPEVIAGYTSWATGDTQERAVVVYESMWESTETMARAIVEAFTDAGIPTRLFDLLSNDLSTIMSDTMQSRYIAVGSPTLNNNLMPNVVAYLTYLKGLTAKNRVQHGIAFGSYGWSGQSIGQVHDLLAEAGLDMSFPDIKQKWRPTEENLASIREQVIEGIAAIRESEEGSEA